MARKSHMDIELFRKLGEKEQLKFKEQLPILGFEEVSMKEKSEFLFKNKNKVPKRVSFDNILQEQYRYKSITGYTVCIHSSLIGQDFADTGSAWIMIINEENKKVFVRKFAKTLAYTLLEKLGAYAKLCKKIADGRHSGFNLIEIESDKPFLTWKEENGSNTKHFILSHYYLDLKSKEKSIIKNKERQYFNNLVKTVDNPEKRDRNKRSTWKGNKK